MAQDLTGRDNYIEAQALFQAIAYQQSLADAKDTAYEWSNHQDMKRILNYRHPVLIEIFQMERDSRGLPRLDLQDAKDMASEVEVEEV